MKHLILSNKALFLFLLFIFNFIYLLLYLIGEFIVSPDIFIFVIILLVSNLVVLFLYMAKGDYLSPKSLFLISSVIFILIRPMLSVVGDFEIITVGKNINIIPIIKAVISVIVIVNFIAFSTVFSTSKVDLYYRFIPKINMFNKYFELLFLLLAFILSFYFLFMSYKGMLKLVSGINYFQFTESGAYNHLKFFFYAKFCFLLSYLFSQRRVGIVFITACCFIVSIGFIIIGLRGYTIAYLFLFLAVLNLKYKIKMFPLVLIASCVLMISSIVLNFRLGFDVTTSYLDMLLSPFHQQGASFEVVFGAVNFKDELINCISFMDYFLKANFGACVDQVRGVNFAEGGGFASSYFAEVYYLGVLPTLLISFVFGIALSFLSSAYTRLRVNLTSDKLSGVIVFFIVPNLVYFARSSAFDFVFKTVQVLILVLLILFFKRLLSKNVQII